jgi:phospholipase/carboxylesterase
MRNRLDCTASELSTRLEKRYSELTTPQPPRPSTSTSPICLFGPERYEPRYEYPLVVWLHSCNSNENELARVMPTLSMQNYVACAPRGSQASDPCGKCYQWASSPTATAVAEESVFEAIDVATSQFSIASHRIFIAGFGAGGSMAWRVGLRYPDFFAGAISICGKFPTQHQPLAKLAMARQLPTLWMYGAQSNRCGVDQVCESLPVLHTARLKVDVQQYPCGDELLTNMLSGMNCWIMEHVTKQPARFEEMREESFSRN